MNSEVRKSSGTSTASCATRLHDQTARPAAVLGYGRVSVQSLHNSTKKDQLTAMEEAAQFRYDVLGSFVHGMQLGAEALYLYVDRNKNDTLEASGEGLAIRPFAGYKVVADVGFTFDAQVGFEYIATRVSASAGSQSLKSASSDVLPLLNLNAGWSFL